MESKKVKEIKDCLQNCINDCGATSCPYDKYEKGLKCIEDLQKDCLTLINELESEKERLSKQLPQFAERVKMEFYAQFDELIPSIMADKIDNILKEIMKK
jgi:hypothetical protein